MPSIPELIERLGDSTVEVRAISEWDIPEILIAHQDDPALHRRLGAEEPPTGAQLGGQVERAAAERQAGTAVSFTLVDPGRDDCRGRIDVHDINWDCGTARLSIWVAPERRRRGYAAAALRVVSAWLAQTARIGTLTLSAEPDNAPLLAAAAAAGFTASAATGHASPDSGADDDRVVLRFTAAG